MVISEKLKKGKNRLATQVTSTVLATMLLLGLGTGCSKKDNSTPIPDGCIRGYHQFMKDITPDEFVILNVGNYAKQINLEEIEKCNEKGIPVGLIISTNAEDEVSIYNEVEYARFLVNTYNLDYPIYLDVENIINSPNINNEMKEKVITNFLGKCTSNGIYSGLYGTDENLSLVEKYFGSAIKDYDAYIVSDSIEQKYQGTASVIEALDNTIYAKEDLSKVIEKQGLNEKENLVNDKKYVIDDISNLNELLNQLSLDSGLSLQDLLEYNNLKIKEIETGTMIKVPSRVGNGVKNTNNTDMSEGLLRGCDISSYQNNIDWEKLSNTCSYVIIKVTQGTTVENSFNNQIENANKYNIPAGVYCFNNYDAMTCNNDFESFKELQIKQAEKTLASLANHKIDYPVYLDIERITSSEEGVYYRELLPRDYAINMINTWYSKVISAGYIPGVYFNEECYNYFLSIYNDLKQGSNKTVEEENFVKNFSACEKWLAGGEQYSNSRSFDVSEVVEPSKERLNKFSDIETFQVTSTGTGFGAGNSSGHLDINYSLEDYTRKNDTLDEEVEIKEFDSKSLLSDETLKDIFIAGGGFITGFAVTLYSTNKRRVRRR